MNRVIIIVVLGLSVIINILSSCKGVNRYSSKREIELRKIIEEYCKRGRKRERYIELGKKIRELGGKEAIQILRKELYTSYETIHTLRYRMGYLYCCIAETRCVEGAKLLEDILQELYIPFPEIAILCLGKISHLIDYKGCVELLEKIAKGEWLYGEIVDKLIACDALTRIEPKIGVPLLLKYLRSDNGDERRYAIDALRRLTDKEFGFDWERPSKEAIKRWERWWEENKDTFKVPLEKSEEI